MIVLDPHDVTVLVVTQRRLGKELIRCNVCRPLLLERVRLAQLEVVLNGNVVEELPEDAIAEAVVVEAEEFAVHPDGDAVVRVDEEVGDGVALARVVDDLPGPAHPARRVLHGACAVSMQRQGVRASCGCWCSQAAALVQILAERAVAQRLRRGGAPVTRPAALTRGRRGSWAAPSALWPGPYSR